jgi:uncharacterized protein
MAVSAQEVETSDDQSEALSFLSKPETYGSKSVRRIDTHGAAVFLAGAEVYKIKRAVRFPFLDYSTLAKRQSACEAEIAINKLNAPNIYLGAVPIVRGPSGLALGGRGEIVEWAVHMRRFDEDATLDRIGERGAIDPSLVVELVEKIYQSHERAPRRDGARAYAALERYLDENDAAFAEWPELFKPARVQRLSRHARSALASIKDLLLARGELGYVRRCHGDLHLRNIALIDGEPTLFDAIEFDEDVATGDVLYDLAFLLMDLEERQMRATANLLFNRYLWRSDPAHLAGLAALPTFLSIRAAIRAKVVAAASLNLQRQDSGQARSEAQRYFRFAEDFLRPHAARLVAIGGLSGTGKSALSGRIAPLIGRAPGAVWLRSDIERKRMFNVGEMDAPPRQAYSESASNEVYARLRHMTAAALESGQSVVVDAVHARPGERESIASVAMKQGVAFAGLWLEAPVKARIDRVVSRTQDASDANATIAAAQTSDGPIATTWNPLDASGEIELVTERALDFLKVAPREELWTG